MGALAGAPAVWGRPPHQRVFVLMCDGFGADYLAHSAMPTLARWKRNGLHKIVRGLMPSVTNVNNTSICCGTWPSEHGITGNSYLDSRTGAEEYMEDSGLVLSPTIFERARAQGVRSALLTSKKKTASLLRRGADAIVAAEAPAPEWTRRYGPAPNIYSREINYWLLEAAVDFLKRRREIGCLYAHTTDYPMHTWPPEAPESREHLARLDALLAEAAAAAPDAAFLVTADHGMNHKTRCWDLQKACRSRGHAIRISISVERDKYVKHHRGFGGTAWVYLDSPGQAAGAARAIESLPGVEKVMTRKQAARDWSLMPSRIGDLVVTGDRDTVFGELDTEMEELPSGYRSHGSEHELEVPLFVYNASGAPPADYFQRNMDVARWVYRK